jgi:uncharacterized membrane protein YbhN (UPF0104 family)
VNATTAVSQPATPDVTAPAFGDTKQSRARRVLQAVVSACLAAGFLIFGLPRIIGTTGHDVGEALRSTSAFEATWLTALWAAGLFVYSFVLTSSLPGLSRGRALTLNLTGSGVSNMLPFGGAAGMSLNYLMIRRWGLSASAFAAFTVVTNVWVVLLKLILPVVAVVALVATGTAIGHTLGIASIVSAVGLTILVVVLISALANRRAAIGATNVLARLAGRVTRLIRRPIDVDDFAAGLLATRDGVADVVADQWAQLTVGMLGYSVLQAALLWGCLHAVGSPISPALALAAYAVDRVLTLAVATPGASGFVEAGTAGVLVALGGAPAVTAAGVLLYRAYTFALEIPVGLTWLGIWAWLSRRKGEAEVLAVPEAPSASDEAVA